MIRRPPRSTLDRSSAASDVYKRQLLDQAHLSWDHAWDLTRKVLAYTNHTLLPEALEKWPVQWFQDMLPRHLEIIFEINRRLLDDVRARYPADEGRVANVSL